MTLKTFVWDFEDNPLGLFKSSADETLCQKNKRDKIQKVGRILVFLKMPSRELKLLVKIID